MTENAFIFFHDFVPGTCKIGKTKTLRIVSQTSIYFAPKLEVSFPTNPTAITYN